MLFKSPDHWKFYNEKFSSGGITSDCYHRALVYTLGICDDTRLRFDEIYDKKKRSIVSGVISAGWQTAGSLRATRLAFNLFTDNTPTSFSCGDSESQQHDALEECKKYSVSDVFCCEFAPFFFQAIAIRYPEYLKSFSFSNDNINGGKASNFYFE